MSEEPSGFKRLYDDLKRRKVFRVAVVYVVGAWVLIQIADATFEPLNLPAWSTSLVLWLLVLGFPAAIILAWALDVTPEGIKRTPAIEPEAAGPALDTGSEPSIAVLPFADMSPEKDQDHFCEGMSEEIINALDKIRDVHVAARTSSFQFKETNIDIEAIGRQLKVKTVLEGSVRKAGGQLRVTAQLIKVEDGYHIWSESFDRELKDVFGIQTEIAENVARAFKLTLTDTEARAIEQQPTDNIEAYEYYLRGRRHFFQLNESGWARSREEFSRAIELDPDYALAFAGLADCFSFLYMYADSSASNRLQAETNSRLALQLKPDLAAVHASRGLALSLGQRHEEAEKAFVRAVEIDPRLFDAYYFHARHAFAQGKFEQAAKLFEKAAEVRPDDYQAISLLAQVYRTLGREEESKQACRLTLEAIEKHLLVNPRDSRALCFGSMSLFEEDRDEEGSEWLQRAIAADPDDAMNMYNVACVYARTDKIEEAIDCLEQSVGKGMAEIDWMVNDSDLDSLRDHPRFKKLLVAAGGA